MFEIGRELVPFRHHRDLPGLERLGQTAPIPAQTSRVRDGKQFFVKLGRLNGLRLIQFAGTGFGSTEQTGFQVILEKLAAVSPENVGEVGHQRIVLLGLMTRAVRDIGFGIFIKPVSNLIILFPSDLIGWSGIKPEVGLHLGAIFVEKVFPIDPDQSRAVVRQGIECLGILKPSVGIQLGFDKVFNAARNLGQVLVVDELMEILQSFVVGSQDLIGIGVNDLVGAPSGSEIEGNFLHQRPEFHLGDVDVDPGEIDKFLDIGGQRGRRRSIFGNEIEVRAGELFPDFRIGLGCRIAFAE